MSQSHPGRGITLMRSIMDEVLYNPAGNEVTLIKHFEAGMSEFLS
ncbi:MAG: ATP-binding protein [Planctomycetaceae bacterium]